MKVEAQLGLSTLVASASEHLPPLLTRLRSLKPSMDEVTEVLEHLSTVDSTFSEAQKKEIAAVVKSTMVDTATASARATAKTQQHLSLHHYLPAKLWACLESDDKRENKFRQLAEFMCQSLGLRNPDAQTKRLAVVVVHLASNVSPAPKEAYEDVQMFGDIIDQKRTSVCSKQTMLAFPEDPKVFMVSYPTAFGAEDPPIACRVSLSSTVERCRKGVTPCRNSNQQVRVHFAKPPTIGQATLAASSSNDSVNGALLSILERYMFQNKEHSPLGGGVPSHSASFVGEHHSPRVSPLVGEPHTPRVSPHRSGSFSSVASGSSPAPMFSGGIPPSCLDPCHDKLANLREKLGCASVGHELPPPIADSTIVDRKRDGAFRKFFPLRRITKKRAATEAEGGSSKHKAKEPSKKKRMPAAAPTAARESAIAPKAARKSTIAPKVKSSKHDALLTKPAKVPRPRQSQAPTKHAGGNIYFSKPKSAYRVYLRIGDRVEQMVKANVASVDDMRQKFQIACALIENDKRPARV